MRRITQTQAQGVERKGGCFCFSPLFFPGITEGTDAAEEKAPLPGYWCPVKGRRLPSAPGPVRIGQMYNGPHLVGKPVDECEARCTPKET